MTGFSDLQRLASRALQELGHASKLHGRLGWPTDAGSSYTIDVPDKYPYVYVELFDGTGRTVIEAENRGVPRRAGLWVLVEKARDGHYVITGPDDERNRLFIGEGAAAIGAVAPHSHQLGTGLEYPIEARRIQPGLVRVHTGMTVWIEAFHYIYNNTRAHWPGGSLDLTSHIPAAGKHRWVIVGIDPADNTAAAAAGTAQDVIVTLTEDDLAAITFASKIPLAAVKLTGGMTAIAEERLFVDYRPWVTGLGSSFTGTSGTGDEVMEWLGV